MSLVVFGSLKAAPGVTTTAIAVAAAWPDPRWTPVLEVDPAGGDLAAEFGMRPDPGLVTMAAALRLQTTWVDVLTSHTQRVTPGAGRGVDVVCGPAAPAAAKAAIAVLAAHAARVRGSGGVVALADCGRLDEGSVAWPLVPAADLVVVVTRRRLPDLAHLAAQAPRLRHAASGRVLLITVGAGYPLRQISDAVGFAVAAALPVDRVAAAALRGCGRLPRRSPLPAAAARAASVIAAAVDHAHPTAPPPATAAAGNRAVST